PDEEWHGGNGQAGGQQPGSAFGQFQAAGPADLDQAGEEQDDPGHTGSNTKVGAVPRWIARKRGEVVLTRAYFAHRPVGGKAVMPSGAMHRRIHADATHKAEQVRPYGCAQFAPMRSM